MVGRNAEIAVVANALAELRDGRAAAIVLRGPAGIGKSRIAAEAMRLAIADGATVLVGRCDDFDRTLPFALVHDLLSRLDRSLRPVFHEVEAALTRPVSQEAAGRTALFRELVDALDEIAATTPVVLVLEDVHVADDESAAIVGLLLRLSVAPVLTIASTRSGRRSPSDLDQLTERLAGEGRLVLLDLDALGTDDIAGLVHGLLDAQPTPQLIAMVESSSGGVPFFVEECSRSLSDSGRIAIESGVARLAVDNDQPPPRPSANVLARLFLGAPADVDVAKTMAAFGRFPLRRLPLVAQLTGQSVAATERSFDQLVRSGILVPSHDGFVFSHAIVRETLYHDIGPAERLRLHRAIADAMRGEDSHGLLPDLLELATHVRESAEPGDREAALILQRAGASVDRNAPAVAARYHQAAAALLQVDDPARGDELVAEALAWHRAARVVEAAERGLDALGALPADAPQRSILHTLVVSDLYLQGRVADALRHVDDALRSDPEDVGLLGARPMLLLQAGHGIEAADALPRAVRELATDRPVRSGVALAALTNVLQCANHLGQTDIAATVLGQLAALADGSSNIARAAHEAIAFGDWSPGIVSRIEGHLATASALRPDGLAVSIGGQLESARGRMLWMLGRWDDALADLRSSVFDLEQRGLVAIAQMAKCTIAEILIDRGDVDEAAVVVEHLVAPISANERNNALAAARLRHATGDVEQARGLLEPQRRSGLAPCGSVWKLAEVLALLLDLSLERGDRSEAEVLSEELRSLHQRTGWLETEVLALRARALVHHDVEAATAAVDVADRERWIVEAARARVVAGTLGVDPGTLLADAYRTFDQMGAAPARRQAAAELRRRELTVPRRSVDPESDLTAVELQLARLVHDGLTNRQIAAAMSYSQKTIEVYLSRLYTKTGYASRRELIRAIDQGALVDRGTDPGV